MSRIQKLENIYQEQLKEYKVDHVSEFIQFIIDADITKGKYARFLIEAFLNDKFLEEDLIGGLNSTVGQAISLFDKHKSKLPLEHRSVYALDKETGEALYQSPGDLWNSVKQFQGELSGKELKREEQDKIYRETEFIYKDEVTGFQIVSPLTEESAQWWGKGTRWCTSAENNNMFWNYAKDSPLLILLMPANARATCNGNKLQLWKYGNDIQFMDEADNEIELEYIEQHWNILEPICLWLNDLKYIPKEYITKELCELAVKQNGRALRYVPLEYKTEELCKLAIQEDGWSLKYIPDELKTLELYELAVQKNGMALYHVPDELRTKKIYEMAVQQNGASLGYISTELRTKELCEIAVKQDGWFLDCVPIKLRTKELCELAIRQNGMALIHIPKEFRTPKLCKLAIQQNVNALSHVPIELRTKKICEMAVQQNSEAFQFVIDKFKDELKHYVTDEVKHCVKDEIIELPMEKYQKTFQEIKTLFPEKHISLSYHHS